MKYCTLTVLWSSISNQHQTPVTAAAVARPHSKSSLSMSPSQASDPCGSYQQQHYGTARLRLITVAGMICVLMSKYACNGPAGHTGRFIPAPVCAQPAASRLALALNNWHSPPRATSCAAHKPASRTQSPQRVQLPPVM